MDGGDQLKGYDRILTTSGSANTDAIMVDQNDVGSSVEEISGALIPASSTAVATNIETTTTVLTPAEVGTPASRAARARGRPGKKWVKTHYEIIDVGSSVEETSGALIPASSTAAATNIETTTTVLTPAEVGTPASRAARARGRPGKKWVKTHYEIIEKLTRENSKYLI